MATPDTATKLIKALDLEELNEKEQKEVMLKLGELLFRDSLIRFLSALPEEKRDEFAGLIKKNASPENIASYITENVPDADQMVSDAVQDLTDDILAVTGKS